MNSEYSLIVGGIRYRLYSSKGKFRVVVAEDEEDWDYEDIELAQEMTYEVKNCRSYDEAIDILLGDED